MIDCLVSHSVDIFVLCVSKELKSSGSSFGGENRELFALAGTRKLSKKVSCWSGKFAMNLENVFEQRQNAKRFMEK